MKARSTKYTIVRADGRVETAIIPDWLADCHDIARKLPHSLVFMHLPAKSSVYAETALSADALVDGPAIIHASKNGRRVQVPNAPKTDTEATALYFSFVANNRHAA